MLTLLASRPLLPRCFVQSRRITAYRERILFNDAATSPRLKTLVFSTSFCASRLPFSSAPGRGVGFMARHPARRMDLAAIVRTIRGVLIVFPWLLQILISDFLLSLLLPLSALRPNLAYDVASKIAESVWRVVQLIFTRLNGANITFSGAELPPNESAIVVANHVSWSDFYMIQALAIKTGMLGRCRWFAKKELSQVPLLGWGLRAMQMPLVSRNFLKDRGEMKQVFGKIVSHQWPTCEWFTSKCCERMLTM